jgi:hypothetical protein
MTTNFGSRNSQDEQDFTYLEPGRWVTFITQAVAAGITSVVTIVITAVVIILLLLGGLWLAYAYLPTNVFTIILAVLIADISLGIVLRSVLRRR